MKIDKRGIGGDQWSDERGMQWWNALSESQRAFWLREAKTAIPALAWGEYRRQTMLENSTRVWGFACTECMAEWTDDADESKCPQCGWRNDAVLRPLPASTA